MVWLYKLQLSYIRLKWDWKVASRFSIKGKVENVIVNEELYKVRRNEGEGGGRRRKEEAGGGKKEIGRD
jgi:hypothetical protein